MGGCSARHTESRGSIPMSIKPNVALSQDFSHSPGFSGKGYHRSAKPSRGEDLDIEEPVVCWYSPAFHLHPTLPGMLGAPLIRHQVVQVSQAGEKRLLAATGMMEPLHREQLPLDSVMRLIQQRAGHRHLGVFK